MDKHFVIVLDWFMTNETLICAVKHTKQEAEEYINEKMNGKEYSGWGIYRIEEI